MPDTLALVTGATGYIGRLLVPRLLDAGYRVRVLVRRPEAVAANPWADRVEVVSGDAQDPAVLRRALAGAGLAYFLIHTMDKGADFADRDRRLAENFGAAARQAGVGRIIYLGGLHPAGGELSTHLASRVEVGEVLLASGVPTAVLQAAVILGDGSASFDMLRYLTARLPVMIGPRWLSNRIQPIAVDDVLYYLVGAATLPAQVNRTFDIGGDEVLTYTEMIRRFAAVAGLRRRRVGIVPVLTPGLASLWIGLVTPVNPRVARPLVDSLVHEVVCNERDLDTLIGPPPGGAIGYDEAVAKALRGTVKDTAWRNLALTGALTAAAAVAGGLATDPESRWFRGLAKPAWQPPAAAFPIVWSLLYADIAGTTAVAASELDRRGATRERQQLLAALLANLALNAGWSWLFFRAHRPAAAAWAAGLLTISSADLARRTGGAVPTAGKVLVPYPLWCAFATVLTAAIARRNP